MYIPANYSGQNSIFKLLVQTAVDYCLEVNIAKSTVDIETDFANYLSKISAPLDLKGLYWVNDAVLSIGNSPALRNDLLKELDLEDYLFESFKYEINFENKNIEDNYKKRATAKGWCASVPFYVLLFKKNSYTNGNANHINMFLLLFIKQYFKTYSTLRKVEFKTKTRFRNAEVCDALRLSLSAPPKYFNPTILIQNYGLQTTCAEIAESLGEALDNSTFNYSLTQYIYSLIRFFSDSWAEAQSRKQPVIIKHHSGPRYKKVVRQVVAGAHSNIHTLIPSKLSIISMDGIDEDDNSIVQQFIQTDSVFEEQREPTDLYSIEAIFDKKRRQSNAINVTKAVRKAHNTSRATTELLSASELNGLFKFCKKLESNTESKPMAIAIWCSFLLSKSITDIEPLKIFFSKKDGEEGLYIDSNNDGWWQFSIEYSAKKNLATLKRLKTTQALAITPCPRWLLELILSVHTKRHKANLINVSDLSKKLTNKLKTFSERKIKGSLSLTKIQSFVIQYINATDIIDSVVFDFSYRNRLYNTRVSRSYANISDINRYKLLNFFWKNVTGYALLGNKVPNDYFFNNDYPENQTDTNIGSTFVPTDAFCIKLVSKLLSDLSSNKPNRKVDVESIMNYHNAYAHYTCWLLNFATGYRAVHNPLPSIALHVPEWSLLTISDKDDIDFTHSRVVAVPNVLNLQLTEYKKHLFRLAELIRLLEPNLAKTLDSLVTVEKSLLSMKFDEAINWYKEIKNSRINIGPLFVFEPSETGKIEYKNISPGNLVKRLDTSLKCPSNAGRHWLKSKLLEKQIRSELVNWQMGHWQAGQAPMSYFSGFSPIEAAKELNIIIEKELRGHGWRVCISKLI